MCYKIVFCNVCDGSQHVYADSANISYFTIRQWRKLLAAFHEYQPLDYYKLMFIPVSTVIF